MKIILFCFCFIFTACTGDKSTITIEQVVTEDSFSQEDLFIQDKLDDIFNKDLNNSTNRHVLLYKEVDALLKGYVDFLFYSNIDSSSIRSYTHSNDEFSMRMEYARDTFAIYPIMDLCQQRDYTTLRMSQCSAYKYETEQALIEKYYKKLYSRLKDQEKDLLETNQKLWEESYNSDIELSKALADSDYSGGGSLSCLMNLSNSRPRIQFLFDCYMQVFVPVE